MFAARIIQSDCGSVILRHTGFGSPSRARKDKEIGMSADATIETYLTGLRAHLRSATASEEEEVVRTVGAHIRNSAAKPGLTVESVIEQLGPVDKVARRYKDAILMVKASKSNSPILLLRASLRNGILGVAAYLIGLAGYWLGGIFAVFGTLALLWSAAQYTPNTRAAVGSSIFQNLTTAILGAAVLVITTLVLRLSLRFSKRAKLPF